MLILMELKWGMAWSPETKYIQKYSNSTIPLCESIKDTRERVLRACGPGDAKSSSLSH